MNNVEASILLLEDYHQSDEWDTLIDADSFAKWFIVCELTGNLDPNIYYYLQSKENKLKIGPVWDAEWSIGLACKGNPNDQYGWYWPQ